MVFEQLRVPTSTILALLALLVSPNPYAAAQPGVAIDFNRTGLSSLRYNNSEYLAGGDFRLDQVRFRSSTGVDIAGDVTSTTVVEESSRRLTQTFAWGAMTVEFTTARNRLLVNVTVDNRSPNILEALWFEPFGLRFQSRVREYDGSVPLITNTYGQPGLVRVSDESGVVVLASEDGAKPVQLGFPWASDRPKNTSFPLSVNTGRVGSLPDSYPTIKRPIPPGASDSFSFSLRFGPPGSTMASLAGDVYQKFLATFPPVLQWNDRRAIGALFLSTAAAGWPKNPRGWLQDPKIDVTTDESRAEFRRRILAYADGSIGILKKMNAQGMITWDIEGQQYRHATSYIGDPRLMDTMAPEMSAVADEYFQRFRDAGLRVGVCIRPQQVVIAPDGGGANQIPVADPTQLLMEKVEYARKRWGATIFYVDSNVNGDDLNPIDAAIFQRLATAFPDVLFVPEHAREQYYAYSAPYRELRQGHASTEADVRALYSNAFSVIYTADGPIDKRFNDLVTGVKQGDILLFRAWYDDPQNEKDSAIYEKAGHPAAIAAVSSRPRARSTTIQ